LDLPDLQQGLASSPADSDPQGAPPLTAMAGSTRTLSRGSTLRDRWYLAAPPDLRANMLAPTHAHAC
jgi:hypothetical protein